MTTIWKFRIRNSNDVYLSISELNKLVNPFVESDDKFLQTLKELILKAKTTQTVQEFGGGGLLELYVLPNGVIDVTHSVMCLELTQAIPVR